MTARPWPEGTRPGASTLLAWLRDPESSRNGEALLILDSLLEASDRAERCLIADHDGDQHRANATIGHLAGQVHRYRLAWISARRRAADPFHAIGILNRARASASLMRPTPEEDPDDR